MSATTIETVASYSLLELRSAYGPVYRRVSNAPPRDCRSDEIPIIDVRGIHESVERRRELAKEIKWAAENTGFFYIKNHGIEEAVIRGAQNAAKRFFSQPLEQKLKVVKSKSQYYNGYGARGTIQVSPTESVDNKETFMWQYDPKHDPETKDPSKVPEDIKAELRCEDMIWEGTSHLDDFEKDTIAYWKSCLTFARALVKVFAHCQDLPDDYFDTLTTYPGADGVYNFYPALTPEEAKVAGPLDVGIGSHTDLQCFTLLWQDEVGGLQVLNKEDQWVRAKPVPGTFVVNIGDFLMRMSNDKFKSTVHRVFNRVTVDRYSMPFFFGFNFNEKCAVLPTCVDKENPAKYEPITCGETSLPTNISAYEAISRVYLSSMHDYEL